MQRARDLGASPTDIADALGVTRQGVDHKLQRLGFRQPPTAERETDTVVVPELEPDVSWRRRPRTRPIDSAA